MTFELPAGLKAALDRLAEGRSRNAIATRAAALSATYRGGGGSTVIADGDDALAYAFARMPATYAAVAACLAEIARLRPDYAPISLLDAGAGPGTATWAAAQTFPALSAFAQLDANPALRALATELVGGDARLSTVQQTPDDVREGLATAADADLVIASYLIAELPAADLERVADALWRRTRDTLVVVEPGTPAGYGRIVALRARLIASGAHVIAPCPHDQACPLQAPDWCHFTQRLSRSRDHKQVKGVALPFEDEKFSYVALTRAPPTHRPSARVLAQPLVGKIEVAAKLCMADGRAVIEKAPRRDKVAYARARRWDWGDAVEAES
ncbi:MAG: small ribosomal subunit Rsm22 family protein [Xanthobacteraceae bacterium]